MGTFTHRGNQGLRVEKGYQIIPILKLISCRKPQSSPREKLQPTVWNCARSYFKKIKGEWEKEIGIDKARQICDENKDFQKKKEEKKRKNYKKNYK